VKKRSGDPCRARYSDGAWYPAKIVSVTHDHVIVRWDPPDPNIPETYRIDDPDADIQ
jgi:hypothetical protein